jgi:hypothetical protein
MSTKEIYVNLGKYVSTKEHICQLMNIYVNQGKYISTKENVN